MQGKFLYDEFIGEIKNEKSYPLKIRALRDKKNSKLVYPEDYLTNKQILSIFSRMTQDVKLGKVSEPKPIKERNEIIYIEENE